MFLEDFGFTYEKEFVKHIIGSEFIYRIKKNRKVIAKFNSHSQVRYFSKGYSFGELNRVNRKLPKIRVDLIEPHNEAKELGLFCSHISFIWTITNHKLQEICETRFKRNVLAFLAGYTERVWDLQDDEIIQEASKPS